MKKIFFLLLGFSTSVWAVGPPVGYVQISPGTTQPGGFNTSTGTVATAMSLPYIAGTQCLQVAGGIITGTGQTCAASAAGVGSTLAVSSNAVIISSPTAIIKFNPNDFLTGFQSGATAQIVLNPNTTDFIHNQQANQAGASFDVDVGTVTGSLTVGANFVNSNGFQSLGSGSRMFSVAGSVFLGGYSGTDIGTEKVCIGDQACHGNNNNSIVAIGLNAGQTKGSSLVAIGANALGSSAGLVSGLTAVGANTLSSIAVGAPIGGDVAIGDGAGASLTTGNECTYVGSGAGALETTPNESAEFGFQAASSNVSGIQNVAVGAFALSGVLGGGNIGLGHSAGGGDNAPINFAVNSGNSIYIGYRSGVTNTADTQSNCIAIGRNALIDKTSAIAIGFGAQASSGDAVAIGANTVSNSSNVATIGTFTGGSDELTVYMSSAITHNLVAGAITDSALTVGQCVQAGAGGLLTVSGSACGAGGGSGGSSALQVTQSGVQITSPTASINFYSGDFTLGAIGSTSTVLLNPATTDFIHNQQTLQAGTTSSAESIRSLSFNSTVTSATATGSGGLTIVNGLFGATQRMTSFDASATSVTVSGVNGLRSNFGVNSTTATFSAFNATSSSVTVTGTGGLAVAGTADGLEGFTIMGTTYTVWSTSGTILPGHIAIAGNTTNYTFVDGGLPGTGSGTPALPVNSIQFNIANVFTGNADFEHFISSLVYTNQFVATSTMPVILGATVATSSSAQVEIVNTGATTTNILVLATSTVGVPLVAVSTVPAKSPYDLLLNLSSPTINTNIVGVQLSGHVVSSGTTPTITGTSCGTTPRLDSGSTDTTGHFTWSGVATACALTFQVPWQNAPSPYCIGVSTMSGIGASAWDVTSTTFSFSGNTGGTITYHCEGGKGG